jgi:hypothetical protein
MNFVDKVDYRLPMADAARQCQRSRLQAEAGSCSEVFVCVSIRVLNRDNAESNS